MVGRIYKLKRAGKQKYWSCSKDKEGCGDAVWTDLEVPPKIDREDHVETCRLVSLTMRHLILRTFDGGWRSNITEFTASSAANTYIKTFLHYVADQVSGSMESVMI
ncbi:U12-hexatoxin-Mg1a [Trichinella spiralis]|uniref:U12-hexatoxin-Mg1a n=1 Tax=Trichinella spiralis TaxID=6334 RepID=A0ABR3KLX0_TRISP